MNVVVCKNKQNNKQNIKNLFYDCADSVFISFHFRITSRFHAIGEGLNAGILAL